MDFDSSSKFISSLAKFLQSLCNGYVEFNNGVEVIGHIYLSVDTGKKIDYILNEKVCKTDENSVTFISNSFHAQPAEKPKPPPKPAKTVEPDKPTDPGSSQDDEILILDEPEPSPSKQNPASRSVRPPSASKRSYQQSFPHRGKSHPAKQTRSSLPSVHNPNGAHETDFQSDPNHSSSFLASQSHPADLAASEADASHLSQVFPQTSSASINSPGSSIQNIKEEPSSDFAATVKQEYDTSIQEDEEQGTYDEQDPNAYYGEEYYGGQEGDQSHDFGQSGGEYYQGAGPSGEAGPGGGENSGSVLYTKSNKTCKWCGKWFNGRFHLREHVKAIHLKIVLLCDKCGKAFSYKRGLKAHRILCMGNFDTKK